MWEESMILELELSACCWNGYKFIIEVQMFKALMSYFLPSYYSSDPFVLHYI